MPGFSVSQHFPTMAKTKRTYKKAPKKARLSWYPKAASASAMPITTITRATAIDPTGFYPVNPELGGLGYMKALGLHFRLADVRNYGDFTNLFQQYRIKSVELTVSPRFTENGVHPGTQATGPPKLRIGYAFTPNTAAPISPDDWTKFQEHADFVERPFDKELKIKLYPRPLDSQYLGVSASGYSTGSKSPWCSILYPDIPHFGLSLALLGWPANAAPPTPWPASPVAYISAKYTFELRGSH